MTRISEFKCRPFGFKSDYIVLKKARTARLKQPFYLPGASCVVIGHNDKIAWGFTNVGPDVMDLYIEKVNPENPN